MKTDTLQTTPDPSGPSPEVLRHRRALAVIRELRETFGMEALAREFLRAYLAHHHARAPEGGLLTERIVYRR